MRTCTKCKKELPESEFHKKGEKLRSACKACTNKQNRDRYEVSKDDKNSKARQYYKENKEKFRKRAGKYRDTENGKNALKKSRDKFLSTEAGKESVKLSQEKWRKKNKQKQRCHWAVKAALKSGKLTKKPCAVCGEEKSEAHHPDYTKPLFVIWLCTKHHKELHRKENVETP